MTLQEIAERLKREFPGRFVSFQVGVTAHTTGCINAGCLIKWEDEMGEVQTRQCSDLNQGIRRLHECIETDTDEPFTIEIR